MNNQTRNHLNLQKHIADQDHIIRVRNAEIAALRKRAEKAEQPRPLAANDITDEMVERALMVNAALFPKTVRRMLTAALTEPPTRPEGAEEIEAYMRELVTSHPEDHYGELADHLASRGVLPPLTDKAHPEEQP